MDEVIKFVRNVLKEVLKEEMKTSNDFVNNDFNKQGGNAVTLEVGVDEDNEVQHRLNLVISIGSPSGYNELSFYFNLTNKENTEITSNPKSIYDREIAKKYLPKDLVGKNIFMDKLKEMLKKLMKMETPKRFVMETYEDHTDIKQKQYYDNLVDIITNNGYFVNTHGVNPISKKYFWEFMNKNVIPPLTEELQREKDNFDNRTGIKDEEYWKRHDEMVEEIMRGVNEQRRNKQKNG